MKKLIVLGMDGLDLKFLEKNSSLDLNNFVHGNLKSTVPPVTIPAWTSLGTGFNPGKLGVVDFFKINDKYERKSLDIAKTFGDEHFFNLIKGKKGLNSYKGLEFDIEKFDLNRLEDKSIPVWKGKDTNEKLKISRKNFEKDKEVIKNLVGHYDLAFYFIHLPDGLIHFGSEKDFEDAYKDIGEFIEEMKNECDKETNLLIVSDHGGKRVDHKFNINRWFKDKGYLDIKETKKKKIFLGITDWLSSKNISLVRTLSDLWSRLSWKKHLTGQDLILSGVDWNNSKVFSVSTALTNFMPVWVNMKGKFEQGCVDKKDYEKLRGEIKRNLEKAKNPDTGEKPVKRVWFKEEVYSGDRMEDMPDIVVETKGNYFIDHRPFPKTFVRQERFVHDLYGTFMAYGPDIKKGKIRADITDVAPTILHMFGEKVPEDMDGRVLKEIFKKDSEPGERKVRYKKGRKRGKKEKTLTKKEQEKVKKRLKALGYEV